MEGKNRTSRQRVMKGCGVGFQVDYSDTWGGDAVKFFACLDLERKSSYSSQLLVFSKNPTST
jgi:hypothetical protein